MPGSPNVRAANGTVVMTVGSGHYEFASSAPTITAPITAPTTSNSNRAVIVVVLVIAALIGILVVGAVIVARRRRPPVV